MSDIAIKVENLSKRYRIGLKEETKDTFVGAMGSILKSPLSNLKRLKKLTQFSNDNQDHDDIIWALKDVSFEVKRGEVIGIIGANGAGKSTLLKILAQKTHPPAGRVKLNGRVASLLEVGTGFHPELTGRENIYLNGTILGMTKKEIDRKLDEIIDFSGVEKFIDTPVKRYSSGMRVRLAFSVAAHLDPEILLIDEVLAVGDLEFQKKCLGKINEVSKRGRTVIFVSHNLAAIKNLCPKVIFLDRGKIIKFSNVNVAIRDYLALDKNESDNNFNDTKKGHVALNQILTIKNIYYLNNKREHVDYIVSGEKMYFDILFNIDQKLKSLDDVLFEIRIKDGIKEKLFTLSTYLTNSNYNNLMNDSSVLCEVNNFSIAPGEYHIDIICSVGKDYSDYLIDCKKINVVDGNYHNSGKKYENILYGPLLIEHNWLKE